MALFEPRRTHESEEISGPTPPRARLSVTVVENDFVAASTRTSPGSTTSRSVRRSIPAASTRFERMGIRPGDRVLEVGVGTGINAALYPRDCAVTGIDLSSSMLEKARERIARKGVRNVRLLRDGRRRT